MALDSKLFEKVIVTTDDEEIANIAKKYGADVPFLRPKELSMILQEQEMWSIML